MPRPRSSMPAYRFHISGQAVVTLAGKDFYLGKHDTPESRARYFALLGEYNSNGMQAPDAITHQVDQPITVRCVTGEYRDHIKTRYANNRTETNRLTNLCTTLELEYGDLPAADFGPRKLTEIRDLFIADGNCRTYVNRLVRGIKGICKHAVSRELCDVSVVIRLDTLEPLKRGQTTAPEPIKVKPVDLAIVRATAKTLSPIIKAMIQLQAATGMRPGEVAEDVVTLKDLCKELPTRPNIATVWRWTNRGVGGIRLETLRIGSQIVTSRQALSRFLQATQR